MTRLSVNVNKVATLRNTRPQLGIPNLIRAAITVLEAGAAGITIHPRPDQRHITADDVDDMIAMVWQHPPAELNIEGNPLEGKFMEHCLRVSPAQATLVPDTTSQATSDHGWDLAADAERIRPFIAELKANGCRVSLFMDAVPAAMALAKAVGADRVELYTEPYARAFAAGDTNSWKPYRDAAIAARDAGLGVNAGHDLNLANLTPFLRNVPGVLEVSIGHALIADALEFGLAATVRKYLDCCRL